ncbi:hypothetical protein FRC09_005452 [Ceratobasidium sp. 395]|nr:hypothetical protein FRC09_005452 [Ceratobasidium sp. 395]
MGTTGVEDTTVTGTTITTGAMGTGDATARARLDTTTTIETATTIGTATMTATTAVTTAATTEAGTGNDTTIRGDRRAHPYDMATLVNTRLRRMRGGLGFRLALPAHGSSASRFFVPASAAINVIFLPLLEIA